MSTATPTRPNNEPSPDVSGSRSQDLLHDETTASGKTRIHPDVFRTLLFVGGAVACLAITAVFELFSRPADIQDFGKVGEQFYADFADPTQATSLEVYVFDADAVKLQDFRVERLENGRWVIPSHHNYPADAEDQLAETASSMIGIQRGAMVTRWEADHARYGVVNPKQKSLNVKEVEGVGSRIILRGADDTVLADYIIGNKVDGEFDQYYVRHPEEDDVYIAQLNIDLSTRFTDWIETDLLEIDRDDVIGLTLNDYSFDELKGQITGREISSLKRKKFNEPWALEGLDEETEELNKDKLRDIVNAIADMQIAGVRPKQQGLTPELTLDRNVIKSQNDVDRIQTDLLTRGFGLQPAEGDDDRLRLIAREGELSAATRDGLVYHLHFGRVFTGSQEELETGLTVTSRSESNQTKKTPDNGGVNANSVTGNDDTSETDRTESDSTDGSTPVAQASTDETSNSENATSDEDKGKNDSSKPGRYAFVRVEFDEQWLDEEPVKPTEPEKPAELVAAESAVDTDTATDTTVDAESNASRSSEADMDSVNEASANTGDEAESEDEEDPLAQVRRKYEQAKGKYDSELAEYERRKNEREEKIKKGQEKAEALNRRFAEWYYVIPGDDFDDITLSRADIVKEKEPESEEADSAADNDSKSDDDQKSDAATPDAETASENAVTADKNRQEISGEETSTETSDEATEKEVDRSSQPQADSVEQSRSRKTTSSEESQPVNTEGSPAPNTPALTTRTPAQE